MTVSTKTSLRFEASTRESLSFILHSLSANSPTTSARRKSIDRGATLSTRFSFPTEACKSTERERQLEEEPFTPTMAQPSKERTRPSSSGSGIDSMSKTDLPETKPAYNATQHFAHVREHLVLFLFCSAVFVLIAGAGVAIAIVFAEAEETRVRDDALQIAVETGGFFSDQFDRAILPLFSLAQFATELDAFKNLPDQIGQAGEPGSLPFLLPEDENETVFRRNITGVCDEPFLVDKFNQIAATLKRNAAMEGVLVNLQFAPHAVVCLLYPLNNTEDFEDGVFMDNSGAQGVDLLADPLSRFIAEQAIQADRVIVAGPRSLRQCKDCHPTVEQAFIARLPVLSSNHEILVDGVGIPRWGFATALINWEALVTHSGIYDSFEANNMEFVLTRTDRDFDTATEMFSENVGGTRNVSVVGSADSH